MSTLQKVVVLLLLSNTCLSQYNYLCDFNSKFTENDPGSWTQQPNCEVSQDDVNLLVAVIWLGADASTLSWTDYKIESKFQIVQAELTSVGIIFRVNSIGNDWYSGRFYAVEADYGNNRIGNHYYNVYENNYSAGTYVSETIDIGTDYTLQVVVAGSSWDIYLNGVYIHNGAGTSFASGSVGLYVYGAKVRFKTFYITLPTQSPTKNPTNYPSTSPTKNPSKSPTENPTNYPSTSPTENPSKSPTKNPSKSATENPTNYPSTSPITSAPSRLPTIAPITTSPTTSQPTAAPTTSPPTTAQPTTENPTASPTKTTSLSSKTKNVTATNQILVIIVAIFIVICCFLLVVLYRRHKQQQKQKIIVAAMKQCGSSNDSSAPETIQMQLYTTQTTTAGEAKDQSDESSESDDDELYKKTTLETVGGNATAGRSVTAGGDQQNEIVHFYYNYMDSAEEPNIDYADNNLLYHEKQAWEMCLMHALNALLQKKEFSIKSMNEICKELAPNKLINPHKSVLQTGNYDANVLMMALTKINIEVEWFDARKANEFDLNDDTFLRYLKGEKKRLVGFILNNPQKAMFKMLSRRHWIAIKQINGVWYNLDSKLQAPKELEVDELTTFLVDNLRANNAELMICRKENKFIQRKVQMNVAINW